jgi:uncharacterized protein
MPMPANLTYPGVYIEELPSGVHTITGVATSITAFVGQAKRGPANQPVRVQSFGEFERGFGGLWADSTLGYAVSQFFQNGGGDALIVRVAAGTAAVAKANRPAVVAAAAKLTLQGLTFVAKTTGAAGNALKVQISNVTAAAFDLIVTQPGGPKTYTGCTLVPANAAFVGTQLTNDAQATIGLAAGTPPASVVADGPTSLSGGVDGAAAVSGFPLVAASAGKWGNNLEMTIMIPASSSNIFNLAVKDSDTGVSEKFLNLSVDPGSPRYVVNVLQQGSSLVQVDTSTTPIAMPGASTTHLAGGADGAAISDADILGSASGKTGLYALENADLFNLLCIPPLLASGAVHDLAKGTRDAAAQYCVARRALFVADPSSTWTTHASVISALDAHMDPSANAALYFPMLNAADPLRENQIGLYAPCGAVAGVMARTDANRGVWKAPAGIEATLNGVNALSVKLTDGENGQLNPLGVNCLRAFPVIGRVVWGARTRRGADQLADQWKYLPVRRLALFLEESLYRGTQWVVFEPNDAPLWAQIRLSIGGFMHNLFRQGAFQGMTPRDAYFVKCDKDTTTQNDIDLGIVNIIVGFAPLKPAEFVVIKIQQIAGQIET